MVSDIWWRTILIARKETRCHHMYYSLRLTARVLLYAPSHRQDSTYHSLCYTSRGALAGTRNTLGWSMYQDANPVPTSPLANDITTAPSGSVLKLSYCLLFYRYYSEGKPTASDWRRWSSPGCHSQVWQIHVLESGQSAQCRRQSSKSITMDQRCQSGEIFYSLVFKL